MTDELLKQHLTRFARGGCSVSALEEFLAGGARLRFWDTDERSADLLRALPPVSFGRADLDAQLRRYLDGGLSSRELSDWAGTMRLLGCYRLDECEPTSSQVWDLMDEIMSPDAWGPISTDSVLELRRRLLALPQPARTEQSGSPHTRS